MIWLSEIRKVEGLSNKSHFSQHFSDEFIPIVLGKILMHFNFVSFVVLHVSGQPRHCMSPTSAHSHHNCIPQRLRDYPIDLR